MGWSEGVLRPPNSSSWSYNLDLRVHTEWWLHDFWCTLTVAHPYWVGRYIHPVSSLPIYVLCVLDKAMSIVNSPILWFIAVVAWPEPVSVNLFQEPRNRFPAWRAGMTTLFVVTGRQATYRLDESISWNRFLGSLIKRVQIRARDRSQRWGANQEELT